MEDRLIKCKDCGQMFTFTVSEQNFYREKGFENDPVRCKECRNLKKANRNNGQNRNRQNRDNRNRQMHTVRCSECGKPALVPFKPSNGKPVFCRDCYNKKE